MGPTVPSFKVGDKLDHYAIIEKIGAGGMGVVFVAEDERLNRRIALKVINRSELGNLEASERFLLEAKTLAKLQHPNVVNIFGIGETQGTIYIAMEYVDGHSLDELIKQGRISLFDAVSIVHQITQTEFSTGNSLFRSRYVDSPDWGSVEVNSLGTFSQLFPLQIGRAVRFDANVQYTKFNGKYVLKKYCKVIGQEVVESALGKLNTVHIDCYDLEADIPADQFFYAPTLGSFVKSKRFRRAVGTDTGVSATVWELVSKSTAVGNK